MEELYSLVREIIESEDLILGVLSNKRKALDYEKVNIEPVLIRGEVKLQFSYEYRSKVIHKNLGIEEGILALEDLLDEEFKHLNLFTRTRDLEVLISKKKKVRINERPASKKPKSLSHNRKKNYILEEGIPHDFLVELGVMNRDGQVVKKRYDKFRQINRFLELVEDSIKELDQSKTLNIVDFGCGKSYLTFGLYYYLVRILGLDVNIVGLDLKEDVISFCNDLASKLDYKGLNFIHGDIRDFKGHEDIDMVVTLHACDIATDAALVKAIGWNSKLILSVPCCQSEFYSKLENKDLGPMLKHGIIREKFASLATDSLRGLVLESLGYKVQLLEFIDMEHTPKNILIRANLRGDKISLGDKKEYNEFKEFLGLKDLFIEGELEKIGISLKEL